MPCGHSGGPSNGSECAIHDPHFCHTVQSMLLCDLGFIHKWGMLRRQIHSWSEEPEVMVRGRQNRTHLSLQGEMPDQAGNVLLQFAPHFSLGKLSGRRTTAR